jgi:hypothetical protein
VYKVVLASVLKSTQDVRLFQKIGLSIHEGFEEVEIHSIGHSASTAPRKIPRTFHYPIFHFQRQSFQRIFAYWKYLKILFQIKPKLLIVGTVELLPASIFYKLISPTTKIIYDIQENYFYNIVYQHHYPFLIKYILAYCVYFVEYFGSYFIDVFFLAEKCYLQELRFIKIEKSMVAENKFLLPKHFEIPKKKNQRNEISFVLSGTISQKYGVFVAVDFVLELHSVMPNIIFHIVGQCPIHKDLIHLERLSEKYPFIKLDISNQAVPYSKILQAIFEADFALLPYQIDRSFENKIPSKFYEYLYFGLPMLISKNKPWQTFFDELESPMAYFIDFNKDTVESLLPVIDQFLKNTLSPIDQDIIGWNKNGLIDFMRKYIKE